MELLQLLVEAGCRRVVGQIEVAAGVLHAFPEYIDGAAPFSFARDAGGDLGAGRLAVVLLVLLPLLRLRIDQEVGQVLRQEAEGLVVVGLGAFVEATGGAKGVVGDGGVGYLLGRASQRVDDGRLEGGFVDLDRHADSLTSILPVTAAEIRAVRYSRRRSMTSVTLAVRVETMPKASSVSSKAKACSSTGGKAILKAPI